MLTQEEIDLARDILAKRMVTYGIFEELKSEDITVKSADSHFIAFSVPLDKDVSEYLDRFQARISPLITELLQNDCDNVPTSFLSTMKIFEPGPEGDDLSISEKLLWVFEEEEGYENIVRTLAGIARKDLQEGQEESAALKNSVWAEFIENDLDLSDMGPDARGR